MYILFMGAKIMKICEKAMGEDGKNDLKNVQSKNLGAYAPSLSGPKRRGLGSRQLSINVGVFRLPSRRGRGKCRVDVGSLARE